MKERYPKAGDANPIAGLRIFDVETGKIVSVDVGPRPINTSTPSGGRRTPVSSSSIEPTGIRITWMFLAADPKTGATRVVVTEKQETWQRNRPLMRFLEDGRRFIWETEKSGWKQYELRNLDGALLNPLTGTSVTASGFPAEAIVKVDEDAGVLWYTARSSEAPINDQLHRVDLDGTDEKQVTTADLHHSGFSIAANGEAVTALRQAVDHAPEDRALYRRWRRRSRSSRRATIPGLRSWASKVGN